MNKTVHGYNSLAACALLMLLATAAQAQQDPELTDIVPNEAQTDAVDAAEAPEAAQDQAGSGPGLLPVNFGMNGLMMAGSR